MRSRKQSRLTEIRNYMEERGVEVIDEPRFDELRSLLAPISDRALRNLLRETEFPLTPSVEGVRQEDFDCLERTLVALTAEYELASGHRERTRQLRRMVITAKEHARFAARRAKEEFRREMKEQMAEWMLVWLENPAIFPQWVRLRRGRPSTGAEPIRPD